jgi:hypothetical protein
MAKIYFTEIDIKVRPHIKHYLNYHYGSPCKFNSGNFVYEFIRLALKNPKKRNEHRNCNLTDTVRILISEDDLKRYGCVITNTSAQNLNDSIDNFIRMQIRTLTDLILQTSETNEDWRKRYLELKKEHRELLELTSIPKDETFAKRLRKFEVNINKRVKEFERYNFNVKDALMQAAYNKLGFDEQILPFETIKKDYYRYKRSESL